MTESDNDPERNPIEVIADEFIDRLRHGDHPTVEEYAARFPELASDIVELLPTVVAMEELKVQKEGSDRSRFLRGPGSLTRLGDFLILGEIGRGGMGIVYEAEQQSLGRHVAVKVLPRQSLLDEHRLQRFQREAQTAARLHHTNIVPIFGVGEQDGYHYYVMQFIRGLGLDTIVRELRGEPPRSRPDGSGTSMSGLARQAANALRRGAFPDTGSAAPDPDVTGPATEPGPDPAAPPPEPAAGATGDQSRDQRRAKSARYWRSVARIGLQIADALSYAHSQGTLHRDIKPANLLLDGKGVVWITDFGLAKAIEDANITHSGDVVGTLQYMAPEQFCGDYDARSDLYCLGLTLYELLTLQPAFAGSNRSGLIQKVSRGLPTAPRRIDPSIPGDLETIVLKTISREPAHRYQSAVELRDDLQRFLEDRSILARRLNPAQVVSRWCRRNKALAAAVGVAILTALVGTAYGWVSYLRQSEKTLEAEAATRKVEDNFDLSMEQFQKLFDALVGTDVFQTMVQEPAPRTEDGNRGAGTSADPQEVPGNPAATGDGANGSTTSPVARYRSIALPVPSKRDAELLHLVLQFYEQFASRNQNQASRRFNIAPAHRKVGDIHLRLGDLRKAQVSYISAIGEYKTLGEDKHAAEIASVRIQLGQVYASQHRMETAIESYSLAVRALENDAGEPRYDDPQWKYELARAHDFLGAFDTRPHRAARSRTARRAARPPGRPRWADDPVPATDRREHHERAQRLFKELLELDPQRPGYQLGMARSCRHYSVYLVRSRLLGRRPGRRSNELHDTAIAILRQLATAQQPDTPHYQFELAQTLASGRGRFVDPVQLKEAEDILDELRRRFDTVPAYREALAQVLIRSSRAYGPFATSGIDELPRLRKAIVLLEELVRQFPDNMQYLRDLADARIQHVDLREAEPHTEPVLLEMIEDLTAAVAEFQSYLQTTDGPRDEWLLLADHYRRLAERLDQAGRLVEAEAAVRKRAAITRRAR